jgi:hypothetical protein
VAKANRLLVTGLVRNSAEHIESEINRLQRHTSKIFTFVDFYCVESDSTDKTPFLLKRLAEEHSNIEVLCLGALEQKLPDRIERLRHCRNLYVDHIRRHRNSRNYDFVMVVDFDIKNRRLNLSPLSSLVNDNNWAGLFVNQTGPYYDIYALRKLGWVDVDCFKEFTELAKVFSIRKAKRLAVWSKMRKIPRSSPLLSIDSAFGGLALYRKEIFERFDYELVSEEFKGESEHVSLHKKITKEGGQLFIVPSMTNFSYTPHNLARYPFFRGIDLLLRASILRRFRKTLRKLLA